MKTLYLKNVEEWCGVKSLFANSIGLSNSWNIKYAANKSRSFVSRLSLAETLEFHKGCVNALNFSTSGDLLASGSDDMKICIWNWCRSNTKPLVAYESGHHGNVFQTKFMPFTNDTMLVSCARDGQVRVGYLSSTRELHHTKKIAQHKGSAHKLSVSNESAHLLRTAGEDGVVYNIDFREAQPSQKLLTVRNDKGGKVALYSIHTNPGNEFEFAVSGRDPWARIFDVRMISEDNKEVWVKRYCPDHLQRPGEKEFNQPNITCLMYNYNGSELLCSFNDEDIYLFDTIDSLESNFTHSFKGHRNSETVKGVNFFGPRSEYIVSGSDCGHVFIWDKTTEEIVNFVKGDDGVVNVLEPHPTTCILATAGLEHNIKIWLPVGEKFDDTSDQLTKQIKENATAREEDRNNGTGRDLFYLMMMMRQMRRHRRQRQRNNADGTSASHDEDGDVSEASSSSSSDDSDMTPDNDDDDNDGDEGTVASACIQS